MEVGNNGEVDATVPWFSAQSQDNLTVLIEIEKIELKIALSNLVKGAIGMDNGLFMVKE